MKMGILGRRLGALVAAIGLAVAAQSASAATATTVTTVTVQLVDKVADAPMATGIVYGMPGVDTSKATSIMQASLTTVPTGKITFKVTNSSTDMVHEMLVVPVPTVGKPLPYLADQHLLDETKINSKGEVSELDPGKSGTLTVTLQPGTYLLLCNQPGHYEAGMWTVFTVTK
jgi:uncharacterized cupredoxin-like copper-binding protein